MNFCTFADTSRKMGLRHKLCRFGNSVLLGNGLKRFSFSIAQSSCIRPMLLLGTTFAPAPAQCSPARDVVAS